MKYDFTTIMDRRGRDAIAVDAIGSKGGWSSAPTAPKEGFSAIPMWVADMNFATVPTIQEAVIERVNHPAFGYFSPSDAYYQSIISWQETRNHVSGLKAEHIGYENGVLGCVCVLHCRHLQHREKRYCFTVPPISDLPILWRIPDVWQN